MPAWPGTLPERPAPEGFKETTPDVLLRTQMDSGPAKVRRRTTTDIRRFTMVFMMTQAQVAIFDTFLLTDLKNGSLSFTMMHPRTEATVTMRLVQQPVYVCVGGTEWNVTLELEQLPG